MKRVSLKGNIREITKKSAVKELRKSGFVPCVFYGQSEENIHFFVSCRELLPILNTPNSYLIDLEIGGKRHEAILHATQYHPVTDEPVHIDFLSISAERPIAINVPVHITGNSEGVRQGGKLILVNRKIRISAMMEDLPDSVEVDISNLAIGKSLLAGDINLGKIQILTPKSAIICSVKMTRAAVGAAAAAEKS